jgi:PAS domain S-box-containing protein
MTRIKEKVNPVNHTEILDEAPVGFMFFAPVYDKIGNVDDFKLEYYNKKTDELMGCFLDEEKTFGISEVLRSKEKRYWFDVARRVYDTGEPVQEMMPFDNTCTRRFSRIQITKTAAGLSVFLTDIHDLYQTIEELSDEEKKYRLLFETSLDGIFLTDDDFNIVSFNPRFSALFAYGREAGTVDLSQLFKARERYEEFTERLREKQYVEGFEAILTGSRNSETPCLINCIPVVDEGGKIIFYQGVVRDITLKKRMDRQLVMAEKLSLTGKIARTIAHEVRNPLTNLRLALDQLKDEISGEGDQDFYLDMIERSADRIQQLIDDLLSSSRPKELQLEEHDVRELIDETLVLVADRLNLKDMQLQVRIDEYLPTMKCDKEELKIALLNLLLNAVEAMEPGKGVLTVLTHYNDQQLEIVIRDNGRGMTEEELGHLFEPFYTAKTQGTGLGLTATQNIIRSHQGHIDVLSEPGIGTEFTIRLYSHNS